MPFSNFYLKGKTQDQLFHEAKLDETIHYLKNSMAVLAIGKPEIIVRQALDEIVARNNKTPEDISAAVERLRLNQHMDTRVRRYLPSCYFPSEKRRRPYIPD